MLTLCLILVAVVLAVGFGVMVGKLVSGSPLAVCWWLCGGAEACAHLIGVVLAAVARINSNE